MPDTELTQIAVNAFPLLKDGTPDPCSDPAYSSTAYCATRRVDPVTGPETPAEWNARQAPPLPVSVTQAAGFLKSVSPWGWIGGLIALWALVRYNRR
jgi:hypothetical protein